ncbi:MAG: hypothetical protein KGI59_02295 [Patescibacteria group bacterium]|nr:hypothetical protein [Patescibacteria group bacterium]
MKKSLITSLIALMVIQSVLPIVHAATNASQFTESLTTTGVSSPPPSVPTNLSTTPISDSRIDLVWNPSTSGGVYAVAGYRIFRDSLFLATTSATNYTDLGLTASTTYDYTVEAFDTAMQISGQSATSSTTTLAVPPSPTPTPTPTPGTGGPSGSGVSSSQFIIQRTNITPTENGADVAFTTSMPAQAVVYWGTTADYEAGSLSELIYGNSHDVQLGNLQPGTTYFVDIKATNAAGLVIESQTSFATLPAAPLSPLPNPSNFQATPAEGRINLDWTNPNDPRFASVRIVRSETFFPKDQFDGLPVYEGSGQSFTDQNVVVGKTYYYAIFAIAADGEFSSGALATARIAPAGEIIVSPTSTDPFANLPESTHVDPMIAGLSLADFEFVQDGKLLTSVNGDTIAIDGGKNLTIRIKYGKVPEVLKTIAFTLTDPSDSSKVFPFLLRVNQDKTYYEATIGALGRSGRYGMSIVILDYQNQGLKRLHGNLEALVFAAIPAEIRRGFDPAGFLLLLLLILLVFLLLMILSRHHKDRGQRGSSARPQGSSDTQGGLPADLPIAHEGQAVPVFGSVRPVGPVGPVGAGSPLGSRGSMNSRT